MDLLIFDSTLRGQKFLSAPPTDTWTRTIKRDGGFWQGSLTISGSIQDLGEVFLSWLGGHIEERDEGLTTWEGLIYEIDFTYQGVTMRTSLDIMTNAVQVQYIDIGNKSEATSTAFGTHAESIARFGRKEEILNKDEILGSQAAALRDSYLAEFGWPTKDYIAVGRVGSAQLSLKAVGYIFTANWKFSTIAGNTISNVVDEAVTITVLDTFYSLANGFVQDNTVIVQDVTDTITYTEDTDYEIDYEDGEIKGLTGGAISATDVVHVDYDYATHDTVSTVISALISTDCEFLTEQFIEANASTVNRDLSIGRRVWDLLIEYVKLGDSSANLYRLYATVGRKVIYEQISPTPKYYLRGGQIVSPNGDLATISPWQITPGVVRYLDYPFSRTEPGSFFDDVRDFLIDEVSVNGRGEISLKTGRYERL